MAVRPPPTEAIQRSSTHLPRKDAKGNQTQDSHHKIIIIFIIIFLVYLFVKKKW